jgi:hypothetical protein
MVASSKRQMHFRALIAAVSVGVLVAELPTPSIATDKPSSTAPKTDPYADFIVEAAQRFEIPEIWIRAVMRAESDGDSRAMSSKGAIGLMQIMPATWDELRARNMLGTDPYDPHDNIIAGAAFIRQLYDRYGSPGFLAAYNAGPKRYDEHQAKGTPLPAETRHYVAVLSAVIGNGATAETQNDDISPAPQWASAPLFIGQKSAPVDAAKPQTDGTSAAKDLPPIAPANPRSDGLFVARSGPKPAQ